MHKSWEEGSVDVIRFVNEVKIKARERNIDTNNTKKLLIKKRNKN